MTTIKKGDFVRCMSSANTQLFTTGKTYQVTESKEGSPEFNINGDHGRGVFCLYPQCGHGVWEKVTKPKELMATEAADKVREAVAALNEAIKEADRTGVVVKVNVIETSFQDFTVSTRVHVSCVQVV